MRCGYGDFEYGSFVRYLGALMEAGTLFLQVWWARNGVRVRPMIALLCLGEILSYFSLPIPLASHTAIALCLLMGFFAAD
jgi:hypothetical protein